MDRSKNLPKKSKKKFIPCQKTKITQNNIEIKSPTQE